MPPPETRRHRLREFHDQLFDGYGQWLSGPRHRLDKMKEQWAYLALAFAASRQVLARICRSDSVDAYEAAVAWAFEQALAPVEGRGSLRVGTEGLGVE